MGARRVSPAEWSALVASGADVTAMFVADWCGYSTMAIRAILGVHEVVLVDLSDAPDAVWDEHAVELVPTAVRARAGRIVAREHARSGVGLPRGGLERMLAA